MKTPLGRRPRIVLVDDDPGLLRLLTIRLRSEGFEVAACESAPQALTSVPRFQPDVLVTDLRMKDKDGIALLKELQGRYPALPVILLTAHGTIPDAVTATKSGAFAFLTKPVEKDQLLEQIEAALKISGFASVTEDWRAGIITRNPVMEDRLSQALMAAGSDAPVLITGQPGTGKAQLAAAIHQASSRRGARFSMLACSTATNETLQAALQGRRKSDDPPPPPGAPAGTLYLDEVADLPLDQQITLNGLLDQEMTRIVSGTARNISDFITRGRFREDLFYRLSVSRIDLPPLSQRRDDVPLLAAHFLDEIARQTGERRVLAPEAVELLMVSDWPGNVRQLATLLQHAASLATGPVISAELVQRALGTGISPQVSTFDEARDEFM
ncbi:MAG: sigma-54-dependent transcriptional regulator, partial [Steroidobacteraceae bacterium]